MGALQWRIGIYKNCQMGFLEGQMNIWNEGVSDGFDRRLDITGHKIIVFKDRLRENIQNESQRQKNCENRTKCETGREGMININMDVTGVLGKKERERQGK